MLKATTGNQSFDITLKNGTFFLNEEPFQLDFIKIKENYYHIIYNNKNFRAELVKVDLPAKTFSIKVNNRVYDILLKDKMDLLLEKLGMNYNQAGKVNTIKAPMPGMILDLRVQVADHVKQGDPLVVLEAMKMENVIKSPGDGVVKSIKIKKGDTVEKSQVLIEF